jgi:hypothetical protein
MTDTPTAGSASPRETAPPAEPGIASSVPAESAITGWVGWVFFAGAMLLMTGVFQAIDGLVALLKDKLYVVRPNGLVVNVDYAAWGWTHLLIGVLLVLVGFAVMAGQTWAQLAAIVLAVLSAIVNFAFIPAYPAWSLLIITLDVVVIYALAAHGDELRTARGREYY